MNEAQLRRVREAWGRAPDYDVASALNSLEDYADQAVDIVKAEARRRGIRAEDAPRVAPPQTYSAIRKILRPTVRFFAPRRWLAAAIFGLVTQSILTQIPPAITVAGLVVRTGILLPIYWFCLGGLCWPLRRYRLVTTVTAVWAISATATGIIIRLGLAGFFGTPPSLSFGLITGLMLALLVSWVVTGLPLSGLVWWRNRFRPVYPPGHCAECGYNLRGLPQPRCPECGTPFTPAPAKS